MNLIVSHLQCAFLLVIAGLDPAIHLLAKSMDPRVKPAGDSGDTAKESQLVFTPSFAGLVALAGSLYPIPSRTRPLNSPAPMVLSHEGLEE